MMKTLYDTYLPNAEARRPRRKPDCPEVSDILRVGWLLEYIGEDSSGQHRNYSSSVKRNTPLLAVPTQSTLPSTANERTVSGISGVTCSHMLEPSFN